MEILFLSAHVPRFLVRRSGGKLDSLYRDTEALIDGLRSVDRVHIKVLTAPDIPSYPQGPFYVKGEIDHEEGVALIGWLNLPIIRFFWSVASMVLSAAKHLNESNERVIVFIPYIVFRHTLISRILKLLYPRKIIQAVVVPDIFFPEGKIKKLINHRAEEMVSKYDCFALFTEGMAEYLHLKEGSYVVNEGYVRLPVRERIDSGVFNVVYTGSLNYKYGIGRLIEAMRYVEDSEVELHIYGKGDAESLVQDASKFDKRIKFYGLVNKEKAIAAIYSATALINPRNSHDGEFTKYSFPSKDIDYLATGNPTLLCRLPGMPHEYYGHFIDLYDATPQQIAMGIMRVKGMSKEERIKFGNEARVFICERMDIHKQGEKIVSLIERVV